MNFEEFQFINYDFNMNDIYAYDFVNSIFRTSFQVQGNVYHRNKKSAMNSLFYVLVLK